MSHDVFISYSSHDRAVADAICARLEAAGVRCWIAPRDILPGDTYAGAIIRAISEATIMLLVFSERANTSPQILREVERAVARGVDVLPVRIEDAKPADELEYFISTHHWLDALPSPPTQHLDRIASVVRQVLAARREASDAPPVAREPGRELSRDPERARPGGDGSVPPPAPAPPPPVRSDPAPAAPPSRWNPVSTPHARRLVMVLTAALIVAVTLWAMEARNSARARSQRNAAMAVADTQSAVVRTLADTTTYGYDRVDMKPFLVDPTQAAELADRHLPPSLRESSVLETVELSVTVGADGSVDPATVNVVSKVDADVADAAREIGRQLRFTPGQMKATPVSVSAVPVLVTFNGNPDTMDGGTKTP